MYEYLDYLVKSDIPIVTCKKPEFRKIIRFQNTVLYPSKVRGALYALCKVMEKKLGKILRSAEVGSISHDAWTKNNVHYVTVLATFVLLGAVETVMVCLSPLPASEYDDKIADVPVPLPPNWEAHVESRAEANRFKAPQYARLIQQNFRYFGIPRCSDWICCQTVDNTNVMPAVARALHIANIGCKNHLLDLEVDDAISGNSELVKAVVRNEREEYEAEWDEELDGAGSDFFNSNNNNNHPNKYYIEAIESCHATMRGVKKSMRAGAMFRVVSHLCPIMRIAQR